LGRLNPAAAASPAPRSAANGTFPKPNITKLIKIKWYVKEAADLDEGEVVARVDVVAGVDEEGFCAVDVAESGRPLVGAGA